MRKKAMRACRGFGVQFLLAASVVLLFGVAFRSLILDHDTIRLAGSADMNWFFGPMQFFFDSRLDLGDFPLWNSMTYAGMPFAAHPLVMAFYPPNLIRSLMVTANAPVDTLFSLSMLSLFHLVLLAVGMYGLAKEEGLSPTTAAVVALGTTFSHPVLFGVVWNIAFLYTVSWVPIILLSLAKAANAVELRLRIGWLVVGGLLYGMQILAGVHQIPIYATLAYILYAGFRIGGASWKSTLPVRETLKHAAGGVAGLALFGFLGVLVAGVLLLPATELFGLSARSPANFERFEHAVGMVDHSFWGRFAFLIGSFLNEPSIDSARLLGAMLSDQYLSLNVGLVIACAAAVLAGVGHRVVIYGSMFYLLFDLCMGSPMPIARILETLPIVASSSSYASILLIVPLGMLAGIGLEAIFARVGPKGLPLPIVILLLIAGSALIVLLPEPAGGRADWNGRWSLLPLGILISISVFSKLRNYRYLVLTALLIETIVCSLALAERQYAVPLLTTTSEDLARTATGMSNPARTISLSHNDNLWALRRAMNGYEPMILDATSRVLSNPGEQGVYSRSLNLRRNRAAVAFLKRPLWLASAYVLGGLPADDRLFPPTKVVFLNEVPEISLPELRIDDVVTSTLADPQTEAVLWAGEGERRLAFTDVALPSRNRALLVDYVSAEPPNFTLRVTGRGDREFMHFKRVPAATTGQATGTVEFPLPDFEWVDIVIEIRAGKAATLRRVLIASDLGDESDLIEVIDDTPDRTVLRVRDAPGPRALVFTDTAYPGWEAFVDDEESPIHVAHGAFKAVVIPAGTHTIRFEFRPWRVRAGLILSLLATTAALSGVGWCFRTGRKPDALGSGV